ncbi:hypothetical protein [Bradyrhizobium manausense]|uniref:Uncharacterized protein n=1 Tax=Bradyrhizobium manausense TaxID=989370 RepID=A0A0R3D010_9BRAD|nr:hypothetical protein [Bradyrhizobium manausense]KRQ03094.1 hypothetical protein AOQ71_30485 [Bradyrhizobium manausense]
MESQHLANARGLRNSKVEVYSFQETAMEKFIQLAFVEERDDTEADEAANHFILSADYYARGSIPNAILYTRACGPRVRSSVLKNAWTDGRSGSVLALNTSSRMMCWNYFTEADPEHLMDADERAELASLGETVRLYRGARMKHDLRATGFALSWTPDYKTAQSFATTHGHGDGSGVVLAADIPRDAIAAWWTESGREIEAIVNPRRVRNVRAVETMSRQAA